VICDDVDIKDALSALSEVKRSWPLNLAVNIRAQKFNPHEEAKLIVSFEQYWFGAFIIDIINLSEADTGKKDNFDRWWKLFCVLCILFVAYRLFS
jgi:hypothetical protein